MAIMVPSERVRTLFLVLTGEQFPTANEDQLAETAKRWRTASEELKKQIGPGLLQLVVEIRRGFSGKAARRFADEIAPFVTDEPQYLPATAERFGELAALLKKTAVMVEYLKLVTILELVMLLAEMAMAAAMAFFNWSVIGWLAARMAIVRFLLRSWWGKLLLLLGQAEVIQIGFQVLIDALAQGIQFAKGTRTEWSPELTAQAVAIGAIGGLLALPFQWMGHWLARHLTGGMAKVFGSTVKYRGTPDDQLLREALRQAAGRHIGRVGSEPFEAISQAMSRDLVRNWPGVFAGVAAHSIAQFIEEGLHEMTTEMLYKLMKEGKFELNPYSFTAGGISGVVGALGHGPGENLRPLPRPGPPSPPKPDPHPPDPDPYSDKTPLLPTGDPLPGDHAGGTAGNGTDPGPGSDTDSTSLTYSDSVFSSTDGSSISDLTGIDSAAPEPWDG